VSPLLRLRWRPFSFTLPQAMVTAQGAWRQQRGWLLRLEAPDGRLGWGEAMMAPGDGLVATGLAGAGLTGAARSQGEMIGAGRAGLDRPGSAMGRADRTAAGRTGAEMIGHSTAGAVRHEPRSEAAMRAASLAAGVAVSPQPVASAFPEHSSPWAKGLAALAPQASRADLEACLPRLPAPLAFALGAALAELDGLVGAESDPWRPAPPSAWLLPAGEGALAVLRSLLASHAPSAEAWPTGPAAPIGPAPLKAAALTLKWKLAAHPDPLERLLLEELLALLPSTARLRLDANGGWDRPTANAWADRLAGEPRLEWLEQPLPPGDQEGLDALAQLLPVALDESLRVDPSLRQRWPGWQVRRPALEGDPRPLLAELRAGRPRLMVSTALETGIGRRWVHHLAALQVAGPTPTAPGLAPGWTPAGPSFAPDPLVVWEAAA
jgi:O-succinylbenzoate synthase